MKSVDDAREPTRATMATKPTKSSAAKQRNLKSKNAAYLWTFVGINLATFFSLLFSKRFAGFSIEHYWNRVTAKDGIIVVCIPIATIVLTGVLSDTMKARLVFWRWRNPLPGCRAFTVLMKTDPRIDVSALKMKHGDLPRAAQAQNSLWYRLYLEHGETLVVSEAHRIYLLTRDMATLSVAFLVVFSVAIVMDSGGWRLATSYIGLLLLQYVFIAAAARNYGNRFVLNVLTEESHK